MANPLNAKRILKIASLSIFFAFLVGYALFNTRDLVFGVKIQDVNIARAEGDPNLMKITGQAKNAKNLELNGREITIDQEGHFEEALALMTGYNMINIRAEDKFGYTDEKNYQLIGK